jgi:hypothetical protein
MRAALAREVPGVEGRTASFNRAYVIHFDCAGGDADAQAYLTVGVLREVLPSGFLPLSSRVEG